MSDQDEQSVVTVTPSILLKAAIDKDLDVEKLEKLLELQERWEARQAQKAFLKAMTTFQNKCPVLTKNKTVKYNLQGGGTVEYKYAPLSDIVKDIKGLLKTCKLSYRWETDNADPERCAITCIISHVDGHSERNTMIAGKDTSGKKNAIQQQASTVTYLQRYTLVGALGISTASDDVDGLVPAPLPPTKESSAALLKEAKAKIDKYTQHVLLQAEGTPLVQGLKARGLNSKHQTALTNHILRKYESLKPE